MPIGFKENTENTENADSEQKNVVHDLNDEDSSVAKSNKNNIIVYAIVAVIVIVIIGMLRSIATHKEEKIDMQDNNSKVVEDTGNNSGDLNTDKPSTNTEGKVTSESDNSSDSTADSTVSVGLPEFDTKENGSTTAIVYSPSDYIKDLNGADIPAVYNVAQRTYERDFVNYEKKRAIIDNGMEMYWLEIVYKEKAYRCQVPYFIFKDLETTGICVVEIEVLTLDGGEQVISYMQVVSDYGELINGN